MRELTTLLRTATATAAATALCYSFILRSWTLPGRQRLLLLLPVLCLLSYLPFHFSTVHLRYFAALLAWITVFKLLLLAFDHGPLSDHLLSLPAFLALSSLPVTAGAKSGDASGARSLLLVPFKAVLLAFQVSHYPYRHRYPRVFFVALVGAHLYLALDIAFACLAAPARALLGRGVPLEPQFWAPYLSASPQEFWGRRWNTPVSRALHAAVYAPVRARLGVGAGVMAAFAVSGVMHEAMFYCATLERQTGLAACYFALQGLLVAAEARRRMPALPWVVAALLTMALVWEPAVVLQYPQLLKGQAEEAVVAESVAALGAAGEVVCSVLGIKGIPHSA